MFLKLIIIIIIICKTVQSVTLFATTLSSSYHENPI